MHAVLRTILVELDRLILQTEQQRQDPLAAVQRALETLDQIIRDQQDTPRVYTEEERRRRWALIIDTILSDPGPEVSQERWVIVPSPAPQPKQTV